MSPVLSALYVYPLKSARGRAVTEAAVEPWGLAGDRRWMLVDRGGKFITQRSQPALALVGAEASPDLRLRVTAPGQQSLMIDVPRSSPTGPLPTRPVRLWRDTVQVSSAGPAANAWFSSYLRSDVSLVYLDDPAHRRPVDPRYGNPGETVTLADGFPILITTSASLTSLNALIEQGKCAVEAPVTMERFRPSIVVDGTAPWAEDDWHRIQVGEVTLRIVKPCGRCVITTIDQQTAVRSREPLRTLGGHRHIDGRLVFGQNAIPENTGRLRVGNPVDVLG